jgi:drug/metabolite transporter (DMT)-like permease
MEPITATIIGAVVWRNDPDKGNAVRITPRKVMGIIVGIGGLALAVYPTLKGDTRPLFLLFGMAASAGCGLANIASQFAESLGIHEIEHIHGLYSLMREGERNYRA